MTWPNLSQPWVVAAVYSAETVAAALALPTVDAAPDFIELRVDHFAANPGALDALVTPAAPRPRIVTVRHPAEGGADQGLKPDARGALYERFLPAAAFVDIEIRSLRALTGTVAAASAQGCQLVASYHDFHGLPKPARLREIVLRAADAGAAVCKIAVTLESATGIARLLDLLGNPPAPLPLAVMGMGRYGAMSRPILGAAGSVLNYGYLGDRPQVSGQWPAALLRERIAELRVSENP